MFIRKVNLKINSLKKLCLYSSKSCVLYTTVEKGVVAVSDLIYTITSLKDYSGLIVIYFGEYLHDIQEPKVIFKKVAGDYTRLTKDRLVAENVSTDDDYIDIDNTFVPIEFLTCVADHFFIDKRCIVKNNETCFVCDVENDDLAKEILNLIPDGLRKMYPKDDVNAALFFALKTMKSDSFIEKVKTEFTTGMTRVNGNSKSLGGNALIPSYNILLGESCEDTFEIEESIKCGKSSTCVSEADKNKERDNENALLALKEAVLKRNKKILCVIDDFSLYNEKEFKDTHIDLINKRFCLSVYNNDPDVIDKIIFETYEDIEACGDLFVDVEKVEGSTQLEVVMSLLKQKKINYDNEVNVGIKRLFMAQIIYLFDIFRCVKSGLDPACVAGDLSKRMFESFSEKLESISLRHAPNATSDQNISDAMMLCNYAIKNINK